MADLQNNVKQVESSPNDFQCALCHSQKYLSITECCKNVLCLTCEKTKTGPKCPFSSCIATRDVSLKHVGQEILSAFKEFQNDAKTRLSYIKKTEDKLLDAINSFTTTERDILNELEVEKEEEMRKIKTKFKSHEQKVKRHFDSQRLVVDSELKEMTKSANALEKTVSDLQTFCTLIDTTYGDRGDELIGERLQKLRHALPVVYEFQVSNVSHTIVSDCIHGVTDVTLTDVSLKKITKRIDDTCDTETKEQILDTAKNAEIIKMLTPDQIEGITQIGVDNSVEVKVEKVGRINRIIIRGRTEDILEVETKINKLLREIEDEAKSDEHAEDLHKHVQWLVDEGRGFEPYPPNISAFIEKAFQKKDPFCEFKEEMYDGHLRVCKVVFGENVEIEVNGDKTNKHPVKRYAPEHFALPADWDAMNKDEQYKTVPLSSASAEYKKVQNEFKQSIVAGGSSFNSVISITRIQNPSLYQRYRVHKEHMDQCNPSGTQNERQLWHGTAAEPIDEINSTGFNRGFCGKNGTAYGKGVYFATFASLSNGYATPDANGHKHMYYSRVLSGVFTRGNTNFIVPPPKDPNKPTIKYDSVVDNEASPKIYVIFFDTQAYPEYLIKFT